MSHDSKSHSHEKRRPISPHLQVYNIFSKDMTSGPSFVNRFTRTGLSFISFYVVAFFICAAMGEEYYNMYLAFITSWFGWLSLFGFSAMYLYYLFNGARFLVFDLGLWLDRKSVLITGRLMILIVVLSFIGTWSYIIFNYMN